MKNLWSVEEMEDQRELDLLRQKASYTLLSRKELERTLAPGAKIVKETPRSFFVEDAKSLTLVSRMIP